jgi:hypothetical protein
MPAPPEIQVTINDPVFQKVCTDLGLKRPVSMHLKQAPSRGYTTRGHAAWDRTITIYYGLQKQELDRLPFVISQISRTILHELRHEWQFENWTEEKWEEDARYSYNIKPSEIDARDFADANLAKYRSLVRVKRLGVSRMGRLGAAEAKARR